MFIVQDDFKPLPFLQIVAEANQVRDGIFSVNKAGFTVKFICMAIDGNGGYLNQTTLFSAHGINLSIVIEIHQQADRGKNAMVICIILLSNLPVVRQTEQLTFQKA